MVVTDVSRLPLLLAVTIGPADAESTEAAQVVWRDLLQAGTPFAALQVYVDQEATQQIGSMGDVASWLAAQPTGSVQAWGIARVVLERQATAPASRPTAPTVPLRDFPDILCALRWLQAEALSPRGHALSLEGTASAIAGLCWQADV